MIEINVQRVEQAAALFRAINPSGPLHIVVDDGNVDDHDLHFCAATASAEQEVGLLRLLRTMPGLERLVAYHLGSNQASSLAWAITLSEADIEQFGPVECAVDGTREASDA